MKLIPGRKILAAASALLLAVVAVAPAGAQGQAPRGGQGEAVLAPADAKVLAQVRVPVNHANIHSGPSTGNEVIVLAAKGTVMPMVGRRGEWIQVQLSPEMRKTGMQMRWYKNEGSGWVHDSMVEFLTPEAKSAPSPLSPDAPRMRGRGNSSLNATPSRVFLRHPRPLGFTRAASLLTACRRRPASRATWTTASPRAASPPARSCRALPSTSGAAR